MTSLKRRKVAPGALGDPGEAVVRRVDVHVQLLGCNLDVEIGGRVCEQRLGQRAATGEVVRDELGDRGRDHPSRGVVAGERQVVERGQRAQTDDVLGVGGIPRATQASR